MERLSLPRSYGRTALLGREESHNEDNRMLHHVEALVVEEADTEEAGTEAAVVRIVALVRIEELVVIVVVWSRLDAVPLLR